MSINDSETKVLSENYSVNTINNNKEVGSQILEPEILAPIYSQKETPSKTTEIVDKKMTNDLENVPEPSETTDETKTYISGGTTPDSPILVKKPMTKYVLNGVVGVLAILVGYKLFFSKN